MRKIIEKYKKYHPSKWEALSYLLIPIFLGLLTATSYDGDFWFLINTGKYIINHGFFTIDPFTMHKGLHVVIQQWIADVLFYGSYSLLGKTGVYLLTNLINVYIVFISYKLAMLVTDKKRNLSVIITLISTGIYSLTFVIARPIMFSTSILITELYFLEKYFKTDNWKYLISLPILSVLLVNMHASMWLMLFCFWLPFFLNTFNYKIGKIESKKRSRKYLLIFALLMLLCGLINPYGIRAMTYVLTSYGIPEINDTVSEMEALNVHFVFGKASFIVVFCVYIVYLLFNKKNIEARHFFLLIGTTYLAISSNRGLLFLIISSIYPFGMYFKDAFKNENTNIKKYYKLFIIFIVVLIIIPLVAIIKTDMIIDYQPMQKGIDYINKIDNRDNIKIYCPYGECNYAEWLGMKPYIDSRAEVFLKANNKKAEIFKEYYYLQEGQIYYKDFLNKYNFDYILALDTDILYTALDNDLEYEEIYGGKTLNTINKKGLNKPKPVYYKIFKKVK